MKYDFKKIREHYEYLTPYIESNSKFGLVRWADPYSRSFNWNEYFSPIEEATWHVIRGCGKVPMYPQYPVDKYFVDFGNPVTKIAIECDGKEWHKDKEKDEKRDKVLAEAGWIVYRISGRDCLRPVPDGYYDDYLMPDEIYRILRTFYETTIEGLVRAIGIVHFNMKPFNKHEEEVSLAVKCLYSRISLLELQYEILLDKTMNTFYLQHEKAHYGYF